jgi:glycerophosphoryl diester phosphodiesterase
MKVLAHRGVTRRHRENTLGAFEEAVREGVDGIETDVRLTADGRLVLHHDRLLPDGRPLAACSLACLERDLAPHAPPTVEAALAAFPDLLWNLEVKAPDALPHLTRLLRAHPSRAHVVLTSFDHAALLEHAAGQGLRLGALLAHRPAPLAGDDVRALLGARLPFDLLVWAFETLDRALVRRLGSAGVRCWVYDPQTEAEHESLRDAGLEAVITDHPERARGLGGA